MLKDGVVTRTDTVSKEELEALKPFYASSFKWRQFRAWVKAHASPAEWLSVRTLKPRLLREVTACTPRRVVEAMDGIEDMLVRIGILPERGAVLTPETSQRVIMTDEKGFSGRGDRPARGVVPRDLGSRASSAVPDGAFKHVTVASFIALAGEPLRPGVVVAGRRWHTPPWPLPSPRRCRSSASKGL